MASRRKLRTVLLLVSVLSLGACFSLVGFNWDEGQHLHPDERFLTMVEGSLVWPSSLSEYFDESVSGLNPRNAGFDFYPYGTLPTTLVKGLSVLLGLSRYDEVYLVGRAVSAASFAGSILLLFLLALYVCGDRRVALLTAFLFATSVLAIQSAHFFTVDSFCSFLVLAATLFLVKAQQSGRTRDFVLTGVFFGMSLASKVSVFTFAVPIAVVGCVHLWRSWKESRHAGRTARSVIRSLVPLVAIVVVTLAAFRVSQPDAFEGTHFFSLAPSPRWLANLDDARQLMNGDVDYPPGHQWANRTPLWFPWKNMVVWGMGLPLGLAAWIGWAAAVVTLILRKKENLLVPVVWVGILFLHQGTQWVKSMRYFLPIYPMLAFLGAWCLIGLWERSRKWASGWDKAGFLDRLPRDAAAATVFFVPISTLVWAIAFSSIYSHPHTRIQATQWIHSKIPSGSVLANEHWDDALPLRDFQTENQQSYETVKLEWYEEDTPAKLERCLDRLDRADYVILSSNRLCDSIPRLPMRYPMTVAYYRSLFDGTLGFEQVAEFASCPSFLGLEFPDGAAEEAFSVYDHPTVRIFKKTGRYSHEHAAATLGSVNWEQIRRVTAREASRLPYWRSSPDTPLEPEGEMGALASSFPNGTPQPSRAATPGITFFPTPTPSAPPTPATDPDLNDDRRVNAIDLLVLVSFLTSDGSNPYGVTQEDADVNKDTVLDKLDLLEFSNFWSKEVNP